MRRLSIVMRVDALISLVYGVLLCAATWDELYEKLELPQPHPWFYGQLAGVFILGWALLLAVAAAGNVAMVLIARVSGLVSVGAALVILVWLYSAEGKVLRDDAGTGYVLLLATAGIVILVGLALWGFSVGVRAPGETKPMVAP